MPVSINGTGTAVLPDASGNVGIGTSSPPSGTRVFSIAEGAANTAFGARSFGINCSLNFQGVGGTSAAPTATTTSTAPLNLVGAATYDGTNFYNVSAMVFGVEATTTSISAPSFVAFSTTPSGSTSRTERVRIDSSGNVGIGTSSPGARLDLFNSGSALAINMTASGNGTALTVDPTFTRLQTANNVPVTFGTNGTERGRFDGSGNFYFNSGYGSVATAYGCRAWVNFNGTGVVAIRASGNVSSITDNGTGDFTVNFTNAMPDTNYCVSASAGGDPVTGSPNTIAQPYRVSNALLTTSVRVSSGFANSAASSDFLQTHVAVFR